MSQQSYLIDTNIIIGLEDYRAVGEAYARFSSLAATHKVDVFVHEAAREDIARDKDANRRAISLSKIAKYQMLKGRLGIGVEELAADFGPLRKPNDVVDATLLHALKIDAVDFVVSQDKGLHERAEQHSAELGRRVLFVGDAADLLTQTFEPRRIPIRHVADVDAHMIDHNEPFFDSLRDGYPEFNDWWRKCIKQRRPCWVVYDNDELAGLIVRKDETADDTDAITKAEKILKVCTFKVSPAKRGVKLGELLLKQVLWFAQTNRYDLAYLTTYADQQSLMSLLEYYGFRRAGTKANGEFIYERAFSADPLSAPNGRARFDVAREHYPRFVATGVRAFGVPIKEKYHDTLFPDLWIPRQADLFSGLLAPLARPGRPGNTIRKVYLCRAPSNLGPAGSILFFYKGASDEPPSQSVTAIGILESVTFARSTRDLMQLAGGRSVYSEDALAAWRATPARPVKVLNFLLAAYIQPAVSMTELRDMSVIAGSPPQSIFEIREPRIRRLLERADLPFALH